MMVAALIALLLCWLFVVAGFAIASSFDAERRRRTAAAVILRIRRVLP